MPALLKKGQLRYAKLPLTDGSIADFPTAFILLEECEDGSWILARPWLDEDAEEGILQPVTVPGVAEKLGVVEQLAW